MFGQGFNYGFISGGPPCFTDTTDIFKDNSGVALYTLDYDASTAIDATTDYSGTPTGVDFGIGGKSLYGARFIGNTSYITLPFMPEIPTNSLPDRSYSVSFWVNSTTARLNSTSGTYRSGQIFGFYDDTYSMIGFGGNTSSSFPAGKLFYYNYGGPGQRNNWIITPNSYADNSWHHVVVTDEYVSSGNTRNRKLYVDGSLIVSDSQANTWNASGGLNTIGSDTANNQLDADVDQVRIFNKAISAAEVGTLYGGGAGEIACVYTPTTTNINYPVTNLAYYKLDNSAVDSHSGTYNGTESNIEYRFGRYGQAASFDGSGDSIQINGFSGFTNYNFTLSIWINSTDTQGYITSFRDPIYITFILGGYSSGSTGMGIYDGTNQYFINNTAMQGINDGNWHHIVMTHDGTNLKGYIDGSIIATVSTGTTTQSSGGTNHNRIGMRGDGNSSSFDYNGLVDQLRLFNSALTSSQVTQLYNEKPETDTSDFKAVLYKGTGATQYISNVGMDLETSGGLIWLKSRNSADNHNLGDSVRGVQRFLYSNLTSQELTSANYFTSFEKNGFFIGTDNSINKNNDSFVSWVWKGGGAPVTIGVNSITGSTPSIASTVSANPAAGFSIIRNTGTANYSDTIGHGLTQAPEIVIQKPVVNNVPWYVLFNIDGTGGWDYGFLNTSAAFTADSPVRFATNSTTINNWGWTNYDMINYCWHSVAGYSKIGTYTWTAPSYTTGTMVTGLGFTPSFVMIKRTNGVGNWQMYDNSRASGTQKYALYSDTADPESTSGYQAIAFDSDGFSAAVGVDGNQTASQSLNNNGSTYLYMAFK